MVHRDQNSPDADRFREFDEHSHKHVNKTHWSITPALAATTVTTSFVVFLQVGVALPTALVVSLWLGAVAVSLGWFALNQPAPVEEGRSLLLRDQKLLFETAPNADPTLVLDLAEPFGLTLLTNRARSNASLIISTKRSSFYVGAELGQTDQLVQHSLLAKASLVATEERALTPAAPDGEEFVVDGLTFSRLVKRLCELDPTCNDRLLLTDARGQLLCLEDKKLSVGSRRFDLRSHLEWRSFLFRESALGGLQLYQGTHVKQGESEVVFVSLLPALSVPSTPGDWPLDAETERSVARDIRLLSASLEEPPNPSLRIAIDRVFMLPLRATLDQAYQQTPSPEGEKYSRPRDLRLSLPNIKHTRVHQLTGAGIGVATSRSARNSKSRSSPMSS